VKDKILLFLIIISALTLRVVGISKYPVGLTQDEAAQGYDTYSLLLTAKDQWGNSFPLTFRSLGDFKLPLYTYLSIPSVAAFGLNEFAVRLPNALLATVSVLVTYLMVNKLTGKKQLALLSALLFSISPWHIALSRGAFEANLTTLLIPIGILAFYKGLEKPKWMILAALLFGLNLFSYHSARLFTPLILFSLIVLNFRVLAKDFWNKYKVAVLMFAIFLFAAAGSNFTGAQKRGLDVSIINPTDKWQAVSDRRYEAVMHNLPDKIARIYSNKGSYLVYQFANNYFTYLSPTSLFTQGVGGWDNGMIPGRGVLYLIEVVFVIASLIYFINGKASQGLNIIFIWFFLSPIPAALSKGSGFAGTRGAVMMPALQIISAYGLYVILRKIKEKVGSNVYNLSAFIISILLIFSLTSFLEDYYYHAPFKGASSMQYGRKEIVEFTAGVENNYDEIFISRTISSPNIWFEFYRKWDPSQVQLASKQWLVYEKLGVPYLDQLDGYKLGKYVFGSIHFDEMKNSKNILIVGKPEEFKSGVAPLKIFYLPDKTPAFYAVEDKNI